MRDKNRNLTRRALNTIRRIQPKNFPEASRVLRMRYIGSGAFRAVYRLTGTNLVIKFPLECRNRTEEVSGGPEVWNSNEGKSHTRAEVRKIRRLLRFSMWEKHLPPIFYFNSKDGVLVTRYYPKTKWAKEATLRLVRELTRKFCGVILGDLAGDNLSIGKMTDTLVILDLGY